MKERPILFSGEMVRAILDGRKTVTRRVMKPSPDGFVPSSWGPIHIDDITREISPSLHSPYGGPGDRLWAITIKPIPGYTRYGAGDDGSIYRIDCPPRKLVACPTSRGYLGVSLCEPTGQRKSRFVHHLVFDAFYSRPEWKGEIRHLDGNRRNNLPENLDFGTPAQNWADRRALRRAIHEDHPSAKLNWEAVREIRASSGPTRAIARRMGLAQSTVQAIRKGETWQETQAAPVVNMPRWASRITLEVTGVRVERVQDITQEGIAAEGISFGNITDQVTGEIDLDASEARVAFEELWDSLNAKRGFGWDKNPWVWVVEFKRRTS